MTSKSPKTILVVDDEPGMLVLLRKWLRVAGRNIITAEDGESAVARARDGQPDLILLDLMLPGFDGIEVIRRLRQDPATADIPVICMTAYIGVEQDKGDEEIDVDGKKFRAFAKPLHNAKLLSEIRRIINRREHGNPR